MTSLVVLAGGAGRRYGGDKQLARVGPAGETLLEHTAYDALRSGFSDVVLVVSPAGRARTLDTVGGLAAHLPLRVVEQHAELPLPHLPTPGRATPWGTAQAVLCAAPVVDGDCAVVNADDWYGPDALRRMAALLRAGNGAALVTYELGRTLSEHGPVNRAVCATDAAGQLVATAEHTGLHRVPEGVAGLDDAGRPVLLDPSTPISMNLWGFSSAVLALMEPLVAEAVTQRRDDAYAEVTVPEVVAALLAGGATAVATDRTEAEWVGLTHPADLPGVRTRLARAAAEGSYPTPLWAA